MTRLFGAPVRRVFLRGIIPAVLLACLAAPAAAADWPTRPIRVISPYPAGSASDTVTRVVTDTALIEAIRLNMKPPFGALSQFKRDCRPTRGETERPLIARLTLHAEKLRLTNLRRELATLRTPTRKLETLRRMLLN